MAWNYIIHKVNMNFEKLVNGIQEFCDRTERAFQAFNHRVVELEQRPAFDEAYVEKMIRRIIAEDCLIERYKDSAKPQIEATRAIKSETTDDPKLIEHAHTTYVWIPFQDIVSTTLFPIDFSVEPISPDSAPSESWKADWAKFNGTGPWLPHGDSPLVSPKEKSPPNCSSSHPNDRRDDSEDGYSPNVWS
ncbi:hypothetical protein K432DRAFT_397065 [Lepidopterella palustris CBS 459.81]|uniref:Uncharacterized protein n=1 Tax=Lepidopterella palustris CBS 459.81 TaxID=1314670 RepID=A0A8E2JBA7_9PEZI|nr:hypothetical protein K432DRAFT_397065 [Lepidopterella palustris CBS 459.81]